MTALLTAESRGTSGPIKNEKIAQAVMECKRLEIPVLAPDINKSLSDFSIEDKSEIRFGLSAIKNVGGAAIQNILEARDSKPFTSLQDFCLRINLSTVNKKTIESLIKSGAMDAFGNRASLLIAYPEIVTKINQIKKQKAEGQDSLFGDDSHDAADQKLDYSFSEIEDFTKTEKLNFEKDFLGIYLTEHPHMDTLSHIRSYSSHQIDQLEEIPEGTRIKLGGIVDSVKRIFTKKTGAEMAFISLADEKGATIEGVIFPRIFELYKNLLIKDSVIVVDAKLDTKNDKATLLIDGIMSLDSLSLDLQPNTH